MIPASGTAPEHAGNPFIYGEILQDPMLFPPEPTRRILGTSQQYNYTNSWAKIRVNEYL